MKKTCAFFLLFFLTITFPLSVAAKVSKKNLSDDRNQQITEIIQSIEEIKQQTGLAEDVKRNALKKLAYKLAGLINDEMLALSNERDELGSRNLSPTSLDTLTQSYDEKLSRLNQLLSKYSLAGIFNNSPANPTAAPTETLVSNPLPKKLSSVVSNAVPNADSVFLKKETPKTSLTVNEPVKETKKTETPKAVPLPFTADKVKIRFEEAPEAGKTLVRASFIDSNDDADKIAAPTAKIKVNQAERGSKTVAKGQDFFNFEVAELKTGDIVTIEIYNGDDQVTGKSEVVSEGVEATKSGLFGILVGGVVISNQVRSYNQADPFFGFQAGWGSRVFGVKGFNSTKPTFSVVNGAGCATEAQIFAQKDSFVMGYNRMIYTDTSNNETVYARTDGETFTAANGCRLKLRKDPFTSWKTFRVSFRFQGLFSAEGRTATATPEDTSKDPFQFISSEQSFSPEFTIWLENRPLNIFSFGPYFTYGATTLVNKDTGGTEPVTDPTTNTPTTATKTFDFDAKRYYDYGLIMHLKFSPEKYFLQAFLGRGNYEALKNSHEISPGVFDKTTQNRFIGKLRIFPEGLAVNFGKQIEATPMFGVDINAGRGPDYFRFFTGFAVRLKNFSLSK
jgi:hypothetical protein